jgi:hypothetical protein
VFVYCEGITIFVIVLYNIQTAVRAHQTSYPMGTAESSTRFVKQRFIVVTCYTETSLCAINIHCVNLETNSVALNCCLAWCVGFGLERWGWFSLPQLPTGVGEEVPVQWRVRARVLVCVCDQHTRAAVEVACLSRMLLNSSCIFLLLAILQVLKKDIVVLNIFSMFTGSQISFICLLYECRCTTSL